MGLRMHVFLLTGLDVHIQESFTNPLSSYLWNLFTFSLLQFPSFKPWALPGCLCIHFCIPHPICDHPFHVCLLCKLCQKREALRGTGVSTSSMQNNSLQRLGAPSLPVEWINEEIPSSTQGSACPRAQVNSWLLGTLLIAVYGFLFLMMLATTRSYTHIHSTYTQGVQWFTLQSAVVISRLEMKPASENLKWVILLVCLFVFMLSFHLLHSLTGTLLSLHRENMFQVTLSVSSRCSVSALRKLQELWDSHCPAPLFAKGDASGCL